MRHALLSSAAALAVLAWTAPAAAADVLTLSETDLDRVVARGVEAAAGAGAGAAGADFAGTSTASSTSASSSTGVEGGAAGAFAGAIGTSAPGGSAPSAGAGTGAAVIGTGPTSFRTHTSSHQNPYMSWQTSWTADYGVAYDID